MMMYLYKSDKIADIKERFSAIYPFLKLEFYNHSHALYAGNKKDEQLEDHITLESINPSINDSNIELLDSMTVNELENTFKDVFNLNVQVFRKSGEQWLQTTSTDNWSLEKHSQKAIEIAEYHRQKM